jgi:hypothetical protein
MARRYWPVSGPITLCGALIGGLLFAATADGNRVAAAATAASNVPDFGINSDMAWHEVGDEFFPPASGARPVTNDPRYPYVSPAVARRTNTQSTYRIADLTNPILQPWAAEQMRKANDAVLAGGVAFRPRERCLPGGVPEFVIYALVEPFYFLQTPREVTIINRGGPEIRRVYLNVPHSAHVKPSWYGESVGHYERDMLVVDTIGANVRATLDSYHTPHSDQLHVVERYHFLKEPRQPDAPAQGDAFVYTGETLQVDFTVDDPKTFYKPWSAIATYRHVNRQALEESICAENNADLVTGKVFPIPTANKPDF